MICGISKFAVLKAVEKVKQEPKINIREWWYDSYRRNLANGKTIQEFISELCGDKVKLI